MVETTAYYEAYCHVLEGLQEISLRDFPFEVLLPYQFVDFFKDIHFLVELNDYPFSFHRE